MTKFALAMAITLGAAAAGGQSAEVHKEWPDFRYLEPKVIRELPAPIRSDLEKRDCKIPKFTKWDARHNVIQGRFLNSAQQDWAVLCHHGDKSSILIYPRGATEDLLSVRTEDHDPYRIIHTISAYVLQKRAIRDKLTESLPAFDHDGIEDGPIQKAAIIYYYRDGEWIEF